MNRVFQGLVVCCLLAALALSGCDLLTKSPPKSGTTTGTGKDLVFNEVFTLAPDKYYAYSWLEIYNPTNHLIRWFDQTFPATGYAVGTNGEIVKSANDGADWTDSAKNASYGTITSINFPNPDTGFFCTDGGKVYKINAFGVTDISGGLPAGHDYSKLQLKAIGGIHTYVSSNQVDRRIQALYVVGDSGLIFRSFNQGGTWTQVLPTRTTPLKKNLKSLFTDFDAKNFFVVGDSGAFYQSTNAGTNWNSKIIPEPFRGTTFRSVWFVDTLGCAVGDNGTILMSTNTGGVWFPETSNVAVNLRGVFFAPNRAAGPNGVLFDPPGQSGWIVGDNGTILRTEDYGQTWLKAVSGTTAQLNSIYFVDSVRGWAFGNGGTILATTDKGRSWSAQNSGTTDDLIGAQFLPLSAIVQNGYYLQMHAQRNYVFFDPITGTLNPDFVTRRDTGTVLFQPQSDIRVNPGGFVVITNDSLKFGDHTKLGPGDTKFVNFGFGVDTAGQGQPNYNPFAHLLKWNLLPSSEVRLVKFFYQAQNLGGNAIIITNFSTKLIDVVRWGGYRPTPDDFPGNVPLGSVPEYWSVARYNNDPGEDPSVESTAYSFYLSNNPLPGWYSQQSR